MSVNLDMVTTRNIYPKSLEEVSHYTGEGVTEEKCGCDLAKRGEDAAILFLRSNLEMDRVIRSF